MGPTTPICHSDDSNPSTILKDLKIKNINRPIFAHININSVRYKFNSLKSIIKDNVDVLLISETKLDASFPVSQFTISGYSRPFRRDRDANGGGLLVFVRDEIPCRHLDNHTICKGFESIFIELNFRKTKWLLCAGYNHNKSNIDKYLRNLGSVLDHYMSKYENWLLLGDLNSEMQETSLHEFCNIYNLYNLIKEPTCYKNPLNPSSIDLILTNKPRSFQNTLTLETGLSDFHKMIITVLRSCVPKKRPVCIKYRDYSNFNSSTFSYILNQNLNVSNPVFYDYEYFKSTFMALLNYHAPMKEKMIRANNAPFMTKSLSKAIMTRSRLRNKFLKAPSKESEDKFKKQRNFCVNLLKKVKKTYYNNLDMNIVLDNKKFWKTIKPLFSDKNQLNNKIVLIEGDAIVSDDSKVASTFNDYFSGIVDNLDIKGYQCEDTSDGVDIVSNAIFKFRNHPSVLMIKEKLDIEYGFTFHPTNAAAITTKISNLDTKKPTTSNCIPVKMIVENRDICAPYIANNFNTSLLRGEFPIPLKKADITPGHKKLDTTDKDNYRPISILPCVSKLFERTMQEQMSCYMTKYLSPYLCGFRKGYSSQYCLLAIIDSWNKALDKGHVAGALLTDLSKAFDCINHELLIAKLDAYGFDKASLKYILSYLTDRQHRTKINNSFSSWANILAGAPQGSILAPDLFNIYTNDIFFFIAEKLANYADDNTPHAIRKDIHTLLQSLDNETSILIKWFHDNYFKMNPEKCHLLVTKHDEDVSVMVDGLNIKGNKAVKLLGVTIDNKLTFNEHVSELCGKVSSKLHALARVSSFMSSEKLRVLLKAFIESQFGYCPLIWMFHSRKLNSRINRLHERALRIVYKDTLLTFEELLELDKSFTIHHRNLQKLATEMYKVKNNISPSFMNEIFRDNKNPHNLRHNPEFEGSNVHSVYNGTETIAYRGPITWAMVPVEIRSSKTLAIFKEKINSWKPAGCTCRLCKLFIPNLGFLS